MGINIVYNGGESRLVEAVDNANTILNSGNLLTIIRNRSKKFFNTTRTCEEIAQVISDCDATVTLKMFTKPAQNNMITTAYVEPSDRNIIYYNTLVSSNSSKSQTNTLVHEAVHIVDIFHDKISGSDFTHKGNDPTNPPQNTDSAPYWIGDRAEDLVDLLDDHVGEEKSFFSMSTVDFALVERYITNVHWSARRQFRCDTA